MEVTQITSPFSRSVTSDIRLCFSGDDTEMTWLCWIQSLRSQAHKEFREVCISSLTNSFRPSSWIDEKAVKFLFQEISKLSYRSIVLKSCRHFPISLLLELFSRNNGGSRDESRDKEDGVTRLSIQNVSFIDDIPEFRNPSGKNESFQRLKLLCVELDSGSDLVDLMKLLSRMNDPLDLQHVQLVLADNSDLKRRDSAIDLFAGNHARTFLETLTRAASSPPHSRCCPKVTFSGFFKFQISTLLFLLEQLEQDRSNGNLQEIILEDIQIVQNTTGADLKQLTLGLQNLAPKLPFTLAFDNCQVDDKPGFLDSLLEPLLILPSLEEVHFQEVSSDLEFLKLTYNRSSDKNHTTPSGPKHLHCHSWALKTKNLTHLVNSFQHGKGKKLFFDMVPMQRYLPSELLHRLLPSSRLQSLQLTMNEVPTHGSWVQVIKKLCAQPALRRLVLEYRGCVAYDPGVGFLDSTSSMEIKKNLESMAESCFCLETISLRRYDRSSQTFVSIPVVSKKLDYFLWLNKGGRRRFLTQGWESISRAEWVNALVESSSELTFVYQILRMNPSLVDDCCWVPII